MYLRGLKKSKVERMRSIESFFSISIACLASTPRIGGERVEFTTLVPGGVPIPIPEPIDRCRADDKVRCSDGSAYICTDQVCDGHADCNDAKDEANCTAGKVF